jgi:hypothetical protein
VAKVCTRSILKELQDSGIELDAEHPMFIHYPLNSCKDYYKFAFVRNPWDRLVSCWFNKIVDRDRPPPPGVVRWNHFPTETLEQMGQFENFVDFVSTLNIDSCDLHLRQQSSLIDLNSIDYLGRFENFDTDISNIFKEIGLPPPNPQVINQSVGRHSYPHYYTDNLAERVAQIYKRDIQIFNYSFQADDWGVSA